MLHEMLKKYRKKHKLTQEQISKHLGVARTTYSGYERGTSEPDIDGLNKISKFFNVSIEELVGEQKKEIEYDLPESEYERVIREAEIEYGINLRDDPNANQMIRDLILGIAKMQQEKK